MATSLTDLIKIYKTVVTDVRNIRYCAVASSALVLYEYFVTLDQEIELVWKSRWSLGKILFLINRYYMLLVELTLYDYGILSTNITDTFCAHWFRWAMTSGILTFAMTQAIQQMRLFALYGKSKRILALMMTSFVLALSASSTIMGITLTKAEVDSHLLPGMPFCIPIGNFDVFRTSWIPFLVSDSFLCGLAVYRGIQIHKLQGAFFRSRNHLVDFFIQDSVMYFMVVFALYLSHTLVFILAPDVLWEATVIFVISVTSVLVNRLILNVRGMLQSSNSRPSATTTVGSTFLSTGQSKPRSSDKRITLHSGTSATVGEETSDNYCDIHNASAGSVEHPGYELTDMKMEAV